MKEIIKLKIDDLDMLGRGIAHNDNKTVFIENSLIEEEIEAKLTSEKKGIYYAENLNILKTSKDRITPLCPYFLDCGGCDLQHLNYEKSLEFKKNQIKNIFNKVAKIKLNDFEIVRSDNVYNYRNKIALKIKSVNGKPFLTMNKKSSHNEIIVTSCKISDNKFYYVINLVNEFLQNNNIIAYDEKSKKGYAKHIVARIIDNNLLLTFVFNKLVKLNFEKLYKKLNEKFTKVGINININKFDKDILSDTFIHIIGIKHIEFSCLNITQKITNSSFLQVNLDIQNKLYNYVLNNIQGTVVNAYSGAGLLTCIIAKNNEKSSIPSAVFGLEINKSASQLADNLCLINNIKNVKNLCGDANVLLKDLNLKNFNLIVDPPRKGLSDEMIKTILTSKPNKIIYISCSPNTLAKNISKLTNNFSIEKIKAFDMFPQTVNVETVCILNLKK